MKKRAREGQPDGYVFHADLLELHASMLILVKEIGDMLEKRYPGYLWAIKPDEEGGVVMIKSLRLAPNNPWWYVIHTKDLQDDPQRKLVEQAAGETLERYGLPREAWKPEFEELLWRNRRGNADADISDSPEYAQKRKRELKLEALFNAGKVKPVLGADGLYRVIARV